MATTVISAFNVFMRDTVNLDSSEVTTARSSRDWLLDQVQKFPNNDSDFPLLKSRYSGYHIYFGSFARKTKTRPLNDIDLMVCMNFEGCSIIEYSHSNIELHFKSDYNGRLKKYYHTTNWNTHKLSSTRITNKFVSSLIGVPQYKKADSKRNGEAATLKLSSYDWNFDIVPCFLTDSNVYLIPNGSGHWKKTDPRIDRDRLKNINQLCGGHVLQVIRAIKYWNEIPYKAKIPSYLLETMISDYYQREITYQRQSLVSNFVDLEIIKVFEYLKNNIYSVVYDPKGISGNINDIGYATQLKFHQRLSSDLDKSNQARTYEVDKNHRDSISKWREVFGTNFPYYTGS